MSRGFFDMQVNGYGGVDLNRSDTTIEQIEGMCRSLDRDGVEGVLATVITAPQEHMLACIRKIAEAHRASPIVRAMIRGIHIEGPFLNRQEGYRGAHPEGSIRPPEMSMLEAMYEAADGLLRLFTLAPEMDDGFKAIKWLDGKGVKVSAGHCDPSIETLRAAVDAGLSVFTHLGNGCPMLVHRHDNVIQRALSLRDRLTFCFIADGVHVPFFALANYLCVAGIDNAVITTDAMQAAGMGPGRYTFGGFDLLVGDDLAVWAPDKSHLVGSASTMQRLSDNLRTHLGLDEDAIDKLMIENPKRLMGL